MTGDRKEKQTAALRWTFFGLFILGLALTGVGLVLFVFFDDQQGEEMKYVLGMLGAGALCTGSLGLVATLLLQRGKFVRSMQVSALVMLVIALLWIIYALKTLLLGYEGIFQPFELSLLIITAPLAPVIVVAFLLSLETRSQEIQNGIRLEAGVLVLSCVTTVLMVIFPEFTYYEFLNIGLTIGWGVTIAGGIAISSALHRENKPHGKLVRTIPKRVKMKMTCPRCEQWLQASSGPARCEDCGLRLIIEIQEPRCPCGYLLYELKGNVCPECGRVIEQRESLNTPHSTSE